MYTLQKNRVNSNISLDFHDHARINEESEKILEQCKEKEEKVYSWASINTPKEPSFKKRTPMQMHASYNSFAFPFSCFAPTQERNKKNKEKDQDKNFVFF